LFKVRLFIFYRFWYSQQELYYIPEPYQNYISSEIKVLKEGKIKLRRWINTI